MIGRTAALLTAASLALVACGGEDDTSEVSATTPPTAAAPADTAEDAPMSGDPSPDVPEPTATPDAGGAGDADDTSEAVVVPELLQFSSPLVGGGEFDAASTAGTPTLFWFWSPT